MLKEWCSTVVSGLVVLSVALSIVLGLGACSFGNQANRPEVLYSENATRALKLQVPPDLTDISDGEQFVLPGASSGPVKRNTLLPQFDSVTFNRQDDQSWLDIQLSPEELWPQLLGFARDESLQIAQTQPVNGIITTLWQPVNAEGSLIRNLIGGDDLYQRAAFRMERAGTRGSRLFVRLQQAKKTQAEAPGANSTQWPPDSHNPEQTSELLQRFLIYLGIQEQRAKGLLDDQAAKAISDDASMTNTAAGAQLVVHHGYFQSFELLSDAINRLGFGVTSSDLSIGEIRVSRKAPAVSSTGDSAAELSALSFTQWVLRVDPVHVSAVNVLAIDADGKPLPPDTARKLLSDLRDILA